MVPMGGHAWQGSRIHPPHGPPASPYTHLEHLVNLGLGLLEVPQDGEDGENCGEVVSRDGLPGSGHNVLPLEHQPVQCVLREGQGHRSGRGQGVHSCFPAAVWAPDGAGGRQCASNGEVATGQIPGMQGAGGGCA